MLSEPISFKRVFLYASMMFVGVGAMLVLYLGMTEASVANDSYALPPSRVMFDEAPRPVYPAAPVGLPAGLSVGLPAEPSMPILLPLELRPAVEELPWPQTLTYHEAKTNPDYYRAWLEAKNPGVRFRAVHAVVTGYCPCPLCCGSGAHGVTRTGVHTSAEPYGIASPEALLRRGVHIPGYLFESAPAKVWKTDDTGSALNDDWSDHVYHFDVRFTSHDWAKRWWGRREMIVYIAQ